MPTWGEARQWDSVAIGAVVDGLKKSRDTLVWLQQDLEMAAVPTEWVGSAADAATERLRGEIARLRRIVTAIPGSSLDQVGLARRGELTGGRSFR